MITMTSFLPALLCNCFRLLNSEIGNDHKEVVAEKLNCPDFRLLNSEIGNDHRLEEKIENIYFTFSSP